MKAYEAGAAIAHIHARDPQNGKPTADPNIFRQVSGIKKRCNLILLPTTGGGINQTIQEKLIPIKQVKPEMCSFDPAPFNLGIFQVTGRYEKSKYDWEQEYMNFWKTRPSLPLLSWICSLPRPREDIRIVRISKVFVLARNVLITFFCFLHRQSRKGGQ